ncbi:cytochrome c peroxidase [Maioricimonas sp. JC845]|uniref:cytochrome c peroxidase n=1 Tax=Maioricimonas sp. JC845 TaxID=3232138 RepID=UPI00345ABA0B
MPKNAHFATIDEGCFGDCHRDSISLRTKALTGMNVCCHAIVAAIMVLGLSGRFAAAGETSLPIRLREPAALALSDDHQRVFVANQQSGTLSVVNTKSWEVVAEHDLGQSLADVVVLPGRDELLAVDQDGGNLIHAAIADDVVMVRERIDVPASPVTVSLSPDTQTIAVASLWPRRCTLLPVSGDGSLQSAERRSVALPFNPRELLWLDDDHLLVADAHAGELAIIQVPSAQIVGRHTLPGHNIRGVSLSPDGSEVWIVHQELTENVPTDFEHLYWGGLIRNAIHVVSVERLLEPGIDWGTESRRVQLGATGYGAADPNHLAWTESGDAIVALGGVNSVSVFPPDQQVVLQRLEVGQRPTDVIVLPGRGLAVVANTHSDTLSVVEIEAGPSAGPLRHPGIAAEVALGPMPELSAADRGQRLFFDATLGLDGWVSCHSCHSDGHSNGLLADTSGDDSYGTPKRVLSLLGTRDNNPWAWNGSIRVLNDQVVKSVRTSMQGDDISPTETMHIVAFLHRLEPPPPLEPVRDEPADRALVARGRQVFDAQGCGVCHVPPLTYTSDQIVDVGIHDEAGARKFNPPSLRGVSQRRRWFHDGRAGSLRSVFEDHGHQLKSGLSEDDLTALLRFLRSL